MCGRYTLTQSAEAIAAAFGLDAVSEMEPRYNIAPTQSVPVVLYSAKKQRQLKLMRWGLIPSWAEDASIGSRLINARSETVSEKPSFRAAFRQRRCLVVADGFYEWQRQEHKKQPYYFHLQNKQPFGFAGLWEHWQSPEGENIETCTILTTEANELMRPIHNRMPVILNSQDYALWLDITAQQTELQHLFHPYSSQAMNSYPVSTLVNKPTNNSAECINSL
ncbi:SOS response-associated peptidase [Gloeocapsopsis crepidinum LEGE 06123]|uniref:Abasic site processing protein n=1 Tax=Gloeocapsopsis crepidinum LEGE 06123 TaxID=588587 RepID=A0ABR9UZZ3_9CHRO|nr:SOS response-associated peptidase [Gloeocapsopsis crepidinum]MBE9193120.1 SOS response-associated peptidase [Gloeocapsopsis crepidinum LEGE 06123]